MELEMRQALKHQRLLSLGLGLVMMVCVAGCGAKKEEDSAAVTGSGEIQSVRGIGKVVSFTPELGTMELEIDGKRMAAWYSMDAQTWGAFDANFELIAAGHRIGKKRYADVLRPGVMVAFEGVRTGDELRIARAWVGGGGVGK